MMEQLQEGYVTSVAATAGCTVEPIPKDLYGCDLRLVRPGRKSDEEEIPLLVQLKNTTTLKPNPAKSAFSFKLRKRVYLEKLAIRRKIEKAILIVMITSPIQAEWTVADHDLMLVKHCCYWETLEGHPVDQNVDQPSVKIRTTNIFDAPALIEIMDRLSKGESLL